jgi:outer membrane receptor protein involved in Fe transport
MQDYMEPSSTSQFYTNLSYEPSSDLSFNFDFMYSRQVAEGYESSSNPGGRTGDLPAIRGELPGNPFRAVAGGGRELFAQPRRDGSGAIVTDAYGQPLPLRDAGGQVLLADNRFASLTMDPSGGVPFREDVLFNSWRPIGKADTIPVRNISTGATQKSTDDRNWRFAASADFTMPFVPSWNGTAMYTLSQSLDQDRQIFPLAFSPIEQGLNCDVINDADACFNPFAVVDDRFLTSATVMEAVNWQPRRDDEDNLQTLDIVFNGSIPLGDYQLPGGEIGAAIGYQRREESLKRTPPANVIAGDQFIGDQVLPFSQSRSVDSWFAEFLVPVLPNVEFSAAYRDESYTTGQGEFIQKYGITYEPTNWLGLRATFGEAFIAPSLSQLNNPQTCGLTNVDDPFGPFAAFTASCSQGNPNLLSETSDSISVGFDLTPIDGLQLSASWSKIDFKDRIVSTTTQDILRTDFLNFKDATGFQPPSGSDFPEGPGDFPPVELVQQWLDNPRSDERIIRSSRDITQIERILQSDSNASTMNVTAVDLDLDYSFDYRDFGTFSVNLSGTYIDDWSFDLGPLDPERQAVGKQNNDFGAVPATPRLRANSRFTWSRGSHLLSTTLRYVSEVDYDANNFGFQRVFPFSNWREVDNISAWTQQDIFYSYRDVPVPGLGGLGSLTLGVRNMWDREAQKVGMTGGMVGELQSPLGRIAYGRLAYEF